MPQNDENNLISIDDVIFWAKRRGVDFGKGDPKERLRYLTKIGLLPHAKRKSFNGRAPNGAYPEYVIGLLVEVDEKLKTGKSVQELKREKERESLVEIPYAEARVYPEVQPAAVEIEPLPPLTEDKALPQFKKIFNAVKIVSLILIVGLIAGGSISFLGTQQVIRENFYNYLSASFGWLQRLAQVSPEPAEEPPVVAPEIFPRPRPEPYLTINAETDIRAPLTVKEKITTPLLSLRPADFEGTLATAALTADRTYTFPNLSGIACLTAGNCVGLGGEVLSPVAGIENRLAKFIADREIGISSIEDFYPGVALTIDTNGRVGIGMKNPGYPLHVAGRIQATGDICTNLAGGRCLSTLPLGGGGGRAGIGGSGTAGYLPIWTAGTTLGDSIIRQIGSVIDVAGTVRMLGFQMPTGALSGLVLTVDDDGTGTWKPIPPVILPGTSGQTLRYDTTEGWIGNYFLYNTGSEIGIGTTSTLAALTLAGNAVFATTTLPQFVLRHSTGNELSFAINGEQSLIEASKRLVLNSLTGEVALAGGVSDFYATSSKIWGATFISVDTDSTVRKSGELVFRASLPIFRYSVPSQTSSTTDTQVSKNFSPTESLALTTPAELPGTSRVYAFLINFADDIATTSSSSWRVFRPNAATTTFTFEFPGQELSSFEIGSPHLTATTTLPDNDWRLDVRVPSADRTIRIFNIFLLAFDQIN